MKISLIHFLFSIFKYFSGNSTPTLNLTPLFSSPSFYHLTTAVWAYPKCLLLRRKDSLRLAAGSLIILNKPRNHTFYPRHKILHGKLPPLPPA